ncbi:MAG: RNA 2',3'-cyclic phosphodiesterase [Rhodospirillales bacterium]|jgi:2'-5' RNA ligase|nr:RNA 2',3'-cyclic phosphodiesterase [Rhodospirillales bacterium]MDP6884621.1 RNA 2',3'-cyclic phosphodiesterase [Rhodospirillales bacterium]
MRLFIAIPLPEAVLGALSELRSGVPGARWVEPEALHLTLRFLGELDTGEAEDIDAALRSIRAPAFDLAISGIGSFQSRRRARSLWAGIRRSEPLAHLQGKVESSVVRAGLEPESRKFKPHVTLARLKNTPLANVGAYLESHGAFAVAPFAVTAFALMRSHLNRDGPHYEALAEYPLENA